jgi:hypothetical protein
MSDLNQGGNEDAVPFGDDSISLNEAATPEEENIDIAASQTEETGESQVPEFNPQHFPLKFRNKTIYPKDRDEAIKWLQQGYGYENKMGALNQRSQELDNRAGRYEQMDQLIKLFEENPEFQEYINKYVNKQIAGQQPGGEETQGQQQTPDIQSLIEQAVTAKVRPYTESLEKQQADGELDKEESALRAKYENVNWDEKDENGHTLMWDVMKHAFDNNFPSLVSAYHDMSYSSISENAAAEALKKNTEEKQRQAKDGIVTSGGTQPSDKPRSVNIRDKSYNDLSAIAVSEMKDF